MGIVGLNGEYLVGIKLFAPDTGSTQQAQQKQAQNLKIVESVNSTLSNMTVGEIVDYCKGDKSVKDLVTGLDLYNGYSISRLKGLMKPDSVKRLISSAVSGLSAKVRSSNSNRIEATQEVELGIREQDFYELKIQEYLGVLLPTYSVTFALRDKKLYKQITDKSELEISFGRDMNTLTTVRCSIFRPVIKDQEDGGVVTLTGFIKSPGFLTDERQYSKEGTSFEIAKQFLQEYGLKLVSNVDASAFKDKMIWRASNTRPIEFAINMWKHSFISNENQIAPSILATGEFVWTDLVKARQEANSDKYKLHYSDRIQFKQNPFYANFGSMRGNRFVHTIADSAMSGLNLTDKKGAISSAQIDPKYQGNRYGKFGLLTPEMHNNWYMAELINASRLFSSMNQTAWIKSEKPWSTFKPTDIITINSVDSPDSGTYLVSGRAVHIYNRKFYTWLEIARDNYTKATGTDIKG